MSAPKRIFVPNALKHDPERFANMKPMTMYHGKCKKCDTSIYNPITGDCVLCKDREILVERARELLAGGEPQFRMTWAEANLLVNSPDSIVTGGPCRKGHTGVRYKRSRQCVTCMSEASQRSYLKRKGRPGGIRPYHHRVKPPEVVSDIDDLLG